MVRLSEVETKVENVDVSLDKLQKTLDDLPKKILTWLLIFGAILTIIQFLGPSLRKVVGMASVQTQQLLARSVQQDTSIPRNP